MFWFRHQFLFFHDFFLSCSPYTFCWSWEKVKNGWVEFKTTWYERLKQKMRKKSKAWHRLLEQRSAKNIARAQFYLTAIFQKMNTAILITKFRFSIVKCTLFSIRKWKSLLIFYIIAMVFVYTVPNVKF